MDIAKERIGQLLAIAEITINGPRPWDIKVHNDAFYRRVLTGGSLALGESYMDGWWDVEELDEFFTRVLRTRLEERIKHNWRVVLDILRAKLMNLQTPSRSFEVGKRHYDLGNTLYRFMLDRRLAYSCGYWEHAATLDQAQEAKLELACRKLELKPGMKVLDIGCGWGSFARYAAENHDVEVLGITVSKEQAALATAACEGLPVEIRLQDYRDLTGHFDRIVSIGMFEHVGQKNHRTFLEVVHRLLSDDGIFLLHTIGSNETKSTTDPWIAKYIFPNSLIPSITQISRASEGLFVMEDWHNFGSFYDKTLMAWHRNVERHRRELSSQYDERFFRMWKYYLLVSAGSFRARSNQLWQIVFSPSGIIGGYKSIRDVSFDRMRGEKHRHVLAEARH